MVFAAYILKPFNVSELLEVIKKTLERRKRFSSLQGALQALGNLWISGIDAQTAMANIETLLGAKHPELVQHASRVNFYSSLLTEHLQLPQGGIEKPSSLDPICMTLERSVFMIDLLPVTIYYPIRIKNS